MGTFKKAARAVASLLRSNLLLTADQRVTRRDQMRPAEAIGVKTKLGAAFLRGTITPRTRAARIASLTPSELAIAKAARWIR